MKRRLAIVVVFASVLVVIFAHRPRNHNNSTQAGAPLGAGEVAGAVAPEFDLPVLDANGKTLKLSDLKGKAVVLNFWATYCVPCKSEMPWLAGLQKQYGAQGLQILGVMKDGDREKIASEFTKKMGVNYPILVGTEKVEDVYGGISGLPTTFFIDRSGKVVARRLGQLNENQAVEDIKKSLGQG